jgi:hypothetical protein
LLGTAGVELLTTCMNDYFTQVISMIHEHQVSRAQGLDVLDLRDIHNSHIHSSITSHALLGVENVLLIK